jgi:hypothetical protein
MEVKGRQRRGDVGPEREKTKNTSSEHRRGKSKKQEKRKTNSLFKIIEKNVCAVNCAAL